MIEQENQAGTVAPEATTEEATEETVSLRKSEYESLNQTLGSLKRELKDLKKSKSEPQEASPQLDSGLVEKTYLRAAGITKEEEVALALETSKKWGVSLDRLVDDEDFQAKLEKHRIQKANLEATTNVRGDKSGGNAKDSTAYWMAKGTPPSRDDVPDDATRRKIVRDMMGSSKAKAKFYNG